MEDRAFFAPDFLSGFIEFYRNHSALWKVKSKEYANTMERMKSWEALCAFCQTKFPTVDVEWVKRKVRNIRGSFNKELKKLRDSEKSRTGAEEPYRPKLWYFDQLLFTADQATPSRSWNSIDLEEGSGLDIDDKPHLLDPQQQACLPAYKENEPPSDRTSFQEMLGLQKKRAPVKPPKPLCTAAESLKKDESTLRKRSLPEDHSSYTVEKKRLVEADRPQTGYHQLLAKLIANIEADQAPNDEFTMIGQVFANKLRSVAKINNNQFILAERLMHEVIYKGMNEELTRFTAITSPSDVGHPSNVPFGQQFPGKSWHPFQSSQPTQQPSQPQPDLSAIGQIKEAKSIMTELQEMGISKITGELQEMMSELRSASNGFETLRVLTKHARLLEGNGIDKLKDLSRYDNLEATDPLA